MMLFLIREFLQRKSTKQLISRTLVFVVSFNANPWMACGYEEVMSTFFLDIVRVLVRELATNG